MLVSREKALSMNVDERIALVAPASGDPVPTELVDRVCIHIVRLCCNKCIVNISGPQMYSWY